MAKEPGVTMLKETLAKIEGAFTVENIAGTMRDVKEGKISSNVWIPFITNDHVTVSFKYRTMEYKVTGIGNHGMVITGQFLAMVHFLDRYEDEISWSMLALKGEVEDED